MREIHAPPTLASDVCRDIVTSNRLRPGASGPAGPVPWCL